MIFYNTYEGLGLVAGKKRILKDGSRFASLFPINIGTDPIVNNSATVYDTIDFIAKVVKETLKDTEKLAPILKSTALQQTLPNIHNFFYDHYQYKLDKVGTEQIRSPSRAFKNRIDGIDCDCFATSVSSLLCNMGIPHFLKIIAIGGRSYFQHIYVIVPKFTNADITKRSNYWVIDPVIDKEKNEKSSFDKEANNITKTHTQKMSIPLQYLNGIENDTLGNEFEGIDEELQGLGSDDELGIAMAFRNRLKRHVNNTVRKIDQSPKSVEAAFNVPRLRSQYVELQTALKGTDDQLMETLEKLSGEEHDALNGNLQEFGNAVCGHDDFLYGALFGDLDEEMLSAVDGLGKKGKNKAKMQTGNKVKKGQFTKIKNAVKISKDAGKKFGNKSGSALKKVGKAIVKGNPVSVAARVGFITAMRTNLATIAERCYWAIQGQSFSTSKGITPVYYNACVRLYDMVKKVFVNVLKGDESALRTAIVNGRAAKKIALVLKGKGMRGVEEVSGFGSVHGLGAVVAATSTAAAATFLAPIIAFVKKNFSSIKMVASKATSFSKKRKESKAPKSPINSESDTVTNENGTRSEAPSDNIRDNINESIEQSKQPDATINEKDGSAKKASEENEKEPGRSISENDNADVSNDERNVAAKDSSTSPKKSNTGLIIGLSSAAVIAGIVIALKKKPASKSIDGLGNFSEKRETKKLKASMSKKKLKLPHGYKVVKRVTI